MSIIAARNTRLTPLLCFLAAGFVVVNTGLVVSELNAFIDGFAEIGIVLIMFAPGFEEDTSNSMASLRLSWGIAFFGGRAPFLDRLLRVVEHLARQPCSAAPSWHPLS